jgi:hypothetical protein
MSVLLADERQRAAANLRSQCAIMPMQKMELDHGPWTSANPQFFEVDQRHSAPNPTEPQANHSRLARDDAGSA